MSDITKRIDEHLQNVRSAMDYGHTVDQIINDMFGPPALTEREMRRTIRALAQAMFERGSAGRPVLKPIPRPVCQCTHMTACNGGCPCANPQMKGICDRCKP